MAEEKTRREEYSDATRRALLESAEALFAVHGFQKTSLDEVAAEARLTKGAIYHHFESKQALFEAVLEQLEVEQTAAVSAAIGSPRSAWEGVQAGLSTFLQHCLDPVYQRLCFIEGPEALGFERWWAMGERHEMGLIRAGLDALEADGLLEPDDLELLAQVLFGGVCAAVLAMARADEPDAVRDRTYAIVTRLICGLRPGGAGPTSAVAPGSP